MCNSEADARFTFELAHLHGFILVIWKEVISKNKLKWEQIQDFTSQLKFMSAPKQYGITT